MGWDEVDSCFVLPCPVLPGFAYSFFPTGQPLASSILVAVVNATAMAMAIARSGPCIFGGIEGRGDGWEDGIHGYNSGPSVCLSIYFS